MDHTVLYHRDDHTDRRRAYGYTQEGNAFVKTDESLTSSTLGDGRVYSSVDDLYKWDQALYTKRLVSAKTLKQAFTPGIAVDPTTGYGFGWYVDNKWSIRVLWHSGNTSGFTTRIQRFPEQNFSIIVLTNRSNAPLADILSAIQELYFLNPPKRERIPKDATFSLDSLGKPLYSLPLDNLGDSPDGQSPNGSDARHAGIVNPENAFA